MNLLVVTVLFSAYSLIGIQTSGAEEEHHKSGAKGTMPAATESSSSGMMSGHGAGSGSGMMGGSDDEGRQGMMGMMSGSDDGGDQGMMRMMDQGMMRMMMSHMMGGPGGMGKMMGRMGSGMKGCGYGPGGMAHMVRMMENLNLTSEQWDQVRALARERLDKMVDLWAQRMKLQIELAGLRWDKEIDPQQVKALFVKKAETKAEMFLAGLAYQRALKEILTPEQLKKLEAQGF